MIELTKEKTMKKLKLYGKKEGKPTEQIATIYVKNGDVIVESDDPKIKEDLKKFTEELINQGISGEKAGATVRVTDDGKLIVEAPDSGIEEVLRKEVKVEKRPDGYFVARWGDDVGNPIHITYGRPKRPTDPDYLENFWIHFWGTLMEERLEEPSKERKFSDYKIDIQASDVEEENN